MKVRPTSGLDEVRQATRSENRMRRNEDEADERPRPRDPLPSLRRAPADDALSKPHVQRPKHCLRWRKLSLRTITLAL
jgi:hypothetical protein